MAEGPDPHRLPEHDLLRERRLRDRAGCRRSTSAQHASTLTARRRRRCSPASPPTRRSTTRSRDPTRRTRAARTTCSRTMFDQQDITPRPSTGSRSRRPSRGRGRPPSRERRARRRTSSNYVKQQLVDKYGTAQRVRRRAAGARRRSTSRCRSPRARRSRSGCHRPGGPSAALVAIDPRDGRVLAMVGGDELPREPVQPRRAGRAPAGLVVQAVRARGRAAAGHLAVDDASTRSRSTISLGDRDLARPQLRGRRTSARSTSSTATIHSDNTVYAQLTKIVGPQNDRRDRHALGITSHLDPYFSIGLGARRRQPARDGAGVFALRERRRARRRLDLRRTSRGRSLSVERPGNNPVQRPAISAETARRS